MIKELFEGHWASPINCIVRIEERRPAQDLGRKMYAVRVVDGSAVVDLKYFQTYDAARKFAETLVAALNMEEGQ